ncbi:MAG: LysR family transcriptional regulator [Oscillospiraceae bacterium]|nr:LysR family transcriptional regulator [Oscillospiraceae bacterium]
MGIEKLDYFVSAAKHRNFTKAAKECGVAQSAISQQIASLENDLNCNLFRRNGRSVELTAQGELLFEDARRIQSMYLQAVQKAQAVACQKEDHCLNIGISGLGSATVLYEKIAQWKQLFPQMEVKLQRYSPEYSRRELTQQLHDAILCYWTPQDDEREYSYQELGRKPIKVLISKRNPLEQQKELAFDQVLEEANKVYMSYDVWTQLNSLGLLTSENQSKIQWFHDSDLLLPMGSINHAVVMTTDLPAQLPEDLQEYPLQDEPVELREILLYRRQNHSRLLQDICATF